MTSGVTSFWSKSKPNVGVGEMYMVFGFRREEKVLCVFESLDRSMQRRMSKSRRFCGSLFVTFDEKMIYLRKQKLQKLMSSSKSKGIKAIEK